MCGILYGTMKIQNRKQYTHVTPPIEFKQLKAVTTDKYRVYFDDDENAFFSVTTCTGFEKEAFFAEWRLKNPLESKRACDRGNALHDLIECYINNDEDLEPVGPEVLLFKQMMPMLRKIDNVQAQEVPLYSNLLGLAGRVDCVAEYDGVLSIIDFKSSKRFKELDHITNYFEQATAYAIMWQELTGVAIPQIVILISSGDGTTQEVISKPVNHVASLKETKDKFFAMVKQSLLLADAKQQVKDAK